MITKKAMEDAQLSGAQAVFAHYGLAKVGAAPMGMFGMLGQGLQRGAKAFGASKQGLMGSLSTGWKAMGAPAQNIVKGIGAGGAAMYAGNKMFGNQDQQRRGPYGY